MELNNNLIISNSSIRAAARSQLKGQWGMAILLCLIYSALGGILGFIDYVGPIMSVLLAGIMTLGIVSCFLKVARNEVFQFENLFDGFKNYKSAIILQLLISILVFLWSLLLLIPGIIASLSYSMSFYILHDNPEIGAKEALSASKSMMQGYKWKLFCLHLSFIGWGLLSVLTLGIGFLWLVPYIKASEANFYQNLKEAYIL